MFTDTRVGQKSVTDLTADSSQRQAAIVAGAGILLMVIPPIFAGSVVNGALVAGDAAATAQNILDSDLLPAFSSPASALQSAWLPLSGNCFWLCGC
jgi:hypothetical protein